MMSGTNSNGVDALALEDPLLATQNQAKAAKKKGRLQSLDLLRGFIMIVMAW